VGFISKKIVPIIKNQAVNLHTNGIMNRQRVYRFVVVLLLMLPARIYAQQQLPLFAQKMPHKPVFPTYNSVSRYPVSFFQDIPTAQRFPVNMEPFNIINCNFYTSHFGFFCRQELKLEKQTDIPLRVRLGSLEYLNKMEGKNSH